MPSNSRDLTTALHAVTATISAMGVARLTRFLGHIEMAIQGDDRPEYSTDQPREC